MNKRIYIYGFIKLEDNIYEIQTVEDLKKVIDLAELEDEKELNILPETE